MEEDDSVVEDARSEEMIQQLRNWQEEQKKRLIEQQTQQRQLLLEKQKKLLSMINSVESGSVQEEDLSALGESFQPLSIAAQEKVTKPSPSMDDIPLKKPRAIRPFQQMLETSLTAKESTKEPQEGASSKKFTFLKRGQGISRFGSITKPQTARKQPVATKAKGKENKAPLAKSVGEPSQPPVADPKPVSIPNKKLAVEIRDPDIEEVSTQVATYHPKIAEEYLGKELATNTSRTEEDLAVFELLERFTTINASFSSSSSLIGQLIENGVTHLPSPSKVLSFLSKRRAPDQPTSSREEFDTDHGASKSFKTGKHVHFAESVVANDESLQDEEPWLAGITGGNFGPPSESVRIGQQPARSFSQPEPPPQINLDETPTSPIGFPDYQKLFGNPARSLWGNEDSSSLTESDPRARLTDPDTDFRGKTVERISNSFSPPL